MSFLWKSIKRMLKEANKNAFFAPPFRIVGKITDDLTKRATFSVKIRRMLNSIDLTTHDIMHNDHYLIGLSANDRKQVEQQYLFELKQPLAYIEEYPIEANKNNEYIFKIFLIDKRKIVCGSASYFIKQGTEILSLLSQRDIIQIASAYSIERFGNMETINIISNAKNNVHYLK